MGYVYYVLLATFITSYMTVKGCNRNGKAYCKTAELFQHALINSIFIMNEDVIYLDLLQVFLNRP